MQKYILHRAMEKFFAHSGPESTSVNQLGDDDANKSDHVSFLTPDPLTETKIAPTPVDTIHLRNLYVSAVIGHDAWNRPDKPQPIILSLQLQADTTSAGNSDDITDTFSYGQMCKDVLTKVSGKTFETIDHLAWDLGELLNIWPGKLLTMQALAPKALLRVEGGLTKECTWRRGIESRLLNHTWAIKGLKIACIIGVNPHERLVKQSVTINLRIAGATEAAAYTRQIIEGNVMWQRLVNRVCDIVEASSFETLEALSRLIAKTALEEFPVPRVEVYVEKPSALTFVEGAGVEISRDQKWLQNLIKSEKQ